MSAFSFSPPITIFFALAGPINLTANGRPNQLRLIPKFISGYPSTAFSDAILKSQAEAIQAAPPRQYPLIAAIVIWSTSKKDQIAGFPKLFLQDLSLVMGSRFSFKSAPEEKFSPFPV